MCCLFPIMVSRHLSTSPGEQCHTIPSNCQASLAIVVSVGFVHMVTLCNLGWSGAFGNPPAPSSQTLGSQVCITTSSFSLLCLAYEVSQIQALECQRQLIQLNSTPIQKSSLSHSILIVSSQLKRLIWDYCSKTEYLPSKCMALSSRLSIGKKDRKRNRSPPAVYITHFNGNTEWHRLQIPVGKGCCKELKFGLGLYKFGIV